MVDGGLGPVAPKPHPQSLAQDALAGRRCSKTLDTLPTKPQPQSPAHGTSPTKPRPCSRSWSQLQRRGSPRPPATSGPSWNQLHIAPPQVVCKDTIFKRHNVRSWGTLTSKLSTINGMGWALGGQRGSWGEEGEVLVLKTMLAGWFLCWVEEWSCQE